MYALVWCSGYANRDMGFISSYIIDQISVFCGLTGGVLDILPVVLTFNDCAEFAV